MTLDERMAIFASWLEEQIHDAQAEAGVPDETRRRYWLARIDAYEYVLDVLHDALAAAQEDEARR